MTVDYSGYTPNTIRIKNNVPVRWIIDVTQISGCTNEIIIPTLGLSKKLTTGKNYVTFTPRKKGRLGFSCWMGMVRGTFIVE
jgi:plastocyanin domain-containing protein